MRANRTIAVLIVVTMVLSGFATDAAAQNALALRDHPIGTTMGSSNDGIAATGKPAPLSILDSAVLAASQISQSGNASATKRRSDGLMWAGVTVWGVGLTMEVLANTALKKDECWVSWTAVYCESGTNKPLLWGGAGVAGAGLVMWLIGNQKVPVAPSLTFVRGGVKATQTLKF